MKDQSFFPCNPLSIACIIHSKGLDPKGTSVTWKHFSFQQMDSVHIIICMDLRCTDQLHFQYQLFSEVSVGNQFILGSTPQCHHPNLNGNQRF